MTLSSFAVKNQRGNRPGDFTTRFTPTIQLGNDAGGVRTTIALHHGRNKISAHLHRDAVECRTSECVVVYDNQMSSSISTQIPS